MAEYYADAISARLAGSDAARDLCRRLIRAQLAYGAAQRAALDSADPEQWRAAVIEALDRTAQEEPLREQLSRRDDASLYASHPPSGYRAQLLGLATHGASTDPVPTACSRHRPRTRTALDADPQGPQPSPTI